MASIKFPFNQYHWARLEKGSTLVVTLDKAANVRLMNSTNFNAYKNGRSHRMQGGGLVTKSPFRLTVPSTGSWYVTVDLIGLKASRVRSSVAVEPPPLAVARSAPMRSPGLVRAPHVPVPDEQGETWDVFISHAGEDKAAVAEPLAIELQRLGLKVWLDKSVLRIGDSLRRKIDYGLAHSAFGVVVLSSSFFAKGWPQYELDAIVTMSIGGEQRMLPIWHEITRDEIVKQAPSLADKVALNTATGTIAEIAIEIAEVIGETVSG
ncbi:DUF1883 domain-containing protein [Actinokineospora guangxiensis]|uniref:DUF1883 domain-containing protein n=1 Tax=Actinokineospora guangxiensis TaxID=1490288 RepID=A0ABW0ER00_9PSEU